MTSAECKSFYLFHRVCSYRSSIEVSIFSGAELRGTGQGSAAFSVTTCTHHKWKRLSLCGELHGWISDCTWWQAGSSSGTALKRPYTTDINKHDPSNCAPFKLKNLKVWLSHLPHISRQSGVSSLASGTPQPSWTAKDISFRSERKWIWAVGWCLLPWSTAERWEIWY